MRHGWILIFASLFSCLQAKPAPDGFADVVQELLPSVVNISTKQILGNNDKNPTGVFKHYNLPNASESLGTGFILDVDGYILTNYHVVNDADKIIINLSNGKEYAASLMGVDERTDVALLKISAPKDELKPIKWADPNAIRMGDWVIAVGNPFRLGSSVSVGVVSFDKREINDESFVSYIQTDAAVNKGNSGGPLFNTKGEVIGINNYIFSPNEGSIGLSFALRVDVAQLIAKKLKTDGLVKRPWLGIGMAAIDGRNYKSYGLSSPKGSLVADIYKGSPAQTAGIKLSDIILKLDDMEIKNSSDLPLMLQRLNPDQSIKLQIWRPSLSKELTLTVKLVELKNDMKVPSNVLNMGLQFGELKNEIKEKLGLDPKSPGLVITDVKLGSFFDLRGVKEGDILISVKDLEVRNEGEVLKAVAAAMGNKRESYVKFQFYRNGAYQDLDIFVKR